jgi:hydrogenase maturation protease
VILVAGIGNIFLGDDAFGSEVVQRMSARCGTADIRIVDFGIRGLDLIYALTDGYDSAIIVDALARGGDPGTVYVIEPDLNEISQVAPVIEAHGMDPLRVLAVARSMGAQLKNIHIVGCEPETFGPDEGLMGLSPRVAAAVEPAIRVVESLIAKFATREAIL